MSGIEEQVDIKELKCELENKTISNIFTEQVKIEDMKKWKDELKFEIIYWGQYNIGVTTLTREYVKSQWESILKGGNTSKEYVDNLYYIDKETANEKEHTYIYDTNVDMVYKIGQTRIGKYKVHSIKELDYQKTNGERDRESITDGTVITAESNITKVGNTAFYEPDLTGFVKEKTKAVYYKNSEEETESTKSVEIPISEYLGSGEEKQRTTIQENEEYEFYNYENQKWANIKVENSGITTYWVWIPRYAYSLNGTETKIVFIDLDDKNAATGEALDSSYVVHPSFKDGKKGIWVSKYESSQVASDTTATEFSYYMPDMSGFNKETTYIEIYKEDGTFTEKKLSEISDLTAFAKENKWFDYENKIWANIKTVSDGIESWWVWIPRYAYNLTGTLTQIMFVDTANNPLSGESLPSNYIVHPAFGNDLKGIWASKYESSQTVGNRETTNDVNIPDLSGFNKENTYIEIYNDNGTFTEKKLSEIGDIKEFIKNNRWYDYSKQIWANIKTVSDEGKEAWWVWIPKYAYNITGVETRIIFLDEDGKPKDGSTLPSNYVPHPGFNGVSGIWASKYEVSESN